MQCPKCSADNDKIRRYCRSCGAPLGIFCDRCGVVNQLEDRFCANCGLALSESLGNARPLPSTPFEEIPAPGRNQYTPQEIEELLSLRRIMKIEEPVTKTLSQDDIDNL